MRNEDTVSRQSQERFIIDPTSKLTIPKRECARPLNPSDDFPFHGTSCSRVGERLIGLV